MTVARKHSLPGFTLIEVLLSLTIIAMMLAIIFGSMSVGFRAWEKGEKAIDNITQESIALTLLARQIRSAHAQPLLLTKGRNPFFRGEQDSVRFISTFSLTNGNRTGLIQVCYKLFDAGGGKGRTLKIYESLLTDPQILEEELLEEDFFPALTGLADFSFSYRGDPKPGGLPGQPSPDEEWSSFWDETKSLTTPRDVLISYTMIGEKGQLEKERELNIQIMSTTSKQFSAGGGTNPFLR
ncbi:MAG: prepilin-type N-terminal cleavage/methylation domain-containing protein [Deltaproteobacteria bacterium]|nr:prepilin-type N-terminal cleavage/methylation domain-containing protein [Deltaproteobacteria bacterium]